MTGPLCGSAEPHTGHSLQLPDGVGWCNGVPAGLPETLTIGSAGHAVGVAPVPTPPWPAYEPPAELREFPATALSVDQQIREKALRHAVAPYIGINGDGLEVDGLSVAILNMATRFETYIRHGGGDR